MAFTAYRSAQNEPSEEKKPTRSLDCALRKGNRQDISTSAWPSDCGSAVCLLRWLSVKIEYQLAERELWFGNLRFDVVDAVCFTATLSQASIFCFRSFF